MKKIISYNVNGIRAAIKKGLINWIQDGDYDIICIQETKAQPEQVDLSELEALGYHTAWHSAEKKGYSGVATISKKKPSKIIGGCGIAKYDLEGRVLRTDFGDLTVLNIYFPSGTTGDIRQQVKYDFLDDIYDWIHEMKKTRKKIIVLGDYNIAHQEIDIHNPKSKSSGFLPDERAWMTKWFESGFTDSFRALNPKKAEYSWWTYRMNARANNKGWRIDYQSVTDNLKNKLVSSRHINEAVHSDHCAVLLEIDL